MRTSLVLGLLALITVFAGGVRLAGLASGLPSVFESDCKIPLQVQLLRNDKSWREKNWGPAYDYPLLLAELTALRPQGERPPQEAPLEEHLAAASRVHLQTRQTIAWLAILLVPGTFLLARRFLDPGPSLLAAALVAASSLHVNFAGQSRPHAAAATVFLFTLLALLRLRRRGDVGSYALAGAMLGLSIGTLQSGLALVPPLLAAHFLRDRERRRPFDPRLLIVLLPLALSVLLFYPYFFLPGGTGTAPDEDPETVEFSGHQLFVEQFNGAGARVVLRTLWFFEPALALLLGLGLVLWALRRGWRPAPGAEPARRLELGVVLAFVLPYSGMLVLYQETYERFLLPLLPAFACLAAWGLTELLRRARARWVLPAGAALALAFPVAVVVQLARARSAPHTTELAATWLVEHARPGHDRVVMLPPLELPLFRTAGALEIRTRGRRVSLFRTWLQYQKRMPDGRGNPPLWDLTWMNLQGESSMSAAEIRDDPEAFVRGLDVDYAVIEVHGEPFTNQGAAELRRALGALGRRVARLSPDGDPERSDYGLVDHDDNRARLPHFSWRVLGAVSVGPVIEIYALDGGPR